MLQTIIDSMPTSVIDLARTKRELSKKTNQLSSLETQTLDFREELSTTETQHEKVVAILEALDIDDLNAKQERINNLTERAQIQARSVADLNINIDSSKNKTHLLEGIPCGSTFPACKFIRDANAAVARLPILLEEKMDKEEVHQEIEAGIAALEPYRVTGMIEKYGTFENDKEIYERRVESIGLTIERNDAAVDKLNIEIKHLNTTIDEYNENREVIENLEHLIGRRDAILASMASKEAELESCKTSTFEYYRQVGSLEQKVEEIKSAKEDYIQLRREYAAYDLFMRCMYSNGIAYDIIKKKIPVINQEVAKMLANIVDFEIFFSSNGNKLDIFIKHPQHDERPIEMGSGAEKTVAAMAIRLALLSVSSLPKGDVFILDEPGTALDEENIEGFIRILELIKVYFKNVLLISHLDSLKDCVDMQVVIEKKAGYAKVNQ